MLKAPSRSDNAPVAAEAKVANQNCISDAKYTTAQAQRQRILEALARGPVSTLRARHELAVMHPAMRILELRRQGCDILTVWSREADAAGVEHRQACYVLAGGACHG